MPLECRSGPMAGSHRACAHQGQPDRQKRYASPGTSTVGQGCPWRGGTSIRRQLRQNGPAAARQDRGPAIRALRAKKNDRRRRCGPGLAAMPPRRALSFDRNPKSRPPRRATERAQQKPAWPSRTTPCGGAANAPQRSRQRKPSSPQKPITRKPITPIQPRRTPNPARFVDRPSIIWMPRVRHNRDKQLSRTVSSNRIAAFPRGIRPAAHCYQSHSKLPVSFKTPGWR